MVSMEREKRERERASCCLWHGEADRSQRAGQGLLYRVGIRVLRMEGAWNKGYRI